MNMNNFLFCSTPASWLEAATQNIPILLIDHAKIRKKAASTALNLMYRYVDRPNYFAVVKIGEGGTPASTSCDLNKKKEP